MEKTRVSVTVYRGAGEDHIDIPAYESGVPGLVVNKPPEDYIPSGHAGQWYITHAASGRRLGNMTCRGFATRKAAIEAAQDLIDMADWTQDYSVLSDHLHTTGGIGLLCNWYKTVGLA